MSLDTWDINCDVCNKIIDKLDQEKGVYIVDDSESVCSINCVKKLFSIGDFKKAKTEWEQDGHSDSYYWTYWEEKEED